MKDKRYILTLALLALFPLVAEAQKSAQATMRVSVKIESGVSATTDSHSNLTFNNDGIQGRLGSIALSGLERNQVYIKTEKELKLTNAEGHTVTLPVNMNDTGDAENVSLQFTSTDREKCEQKYEGMYSGTLTTTIDYF